MWGIRGLMQNNGKQLIIGLTGGVGAGKSRVMAILKETYGAKLLLADQEAHELMEPGQPGYEAVLRAFGPDFIKEDGTLDRSLLSHLLFHDEKVLENVNGLIHPLVWRSVKEKISAASASLIVVEAAIMGLEQKELFDEIWYVHASEEVRMKRLMESRGYSKNQVLSIMRNQMTSLQYRVLADRVITNDGTDGELKAALEAIWKEKGRYT